MDPHDKIIKILKGLNDISLVFSVATMTGSNTCKVNGLLLKSDDLYISEHLTTGYVKSITQSGVTVTAEYSEALKSGDTVVIVKIDDEKYAILERVV